MTKTFLSLASPSSSISARACVRASSPLVLSGSGGFHAAASAAGGCNLAAARTSVTLSGERVRASKLIKLQLLFQSCSEPV